MLAAGRTAVFLHFDLPGIDPNTIDLTVEQNVLSVTAERLYARKEGDQIIAKERLLGEHLDPERLQASYEQGVLTIQIPVAPEAKPRRIEIRAGEGSTERQVIDVEGTKTQESE